MASLSRRKRLFFIAVMLLLLLVLSELISFGAGKYLQSKGLFIQPWVGDYGRFIVKRDPILGWPSRYELLGGRWDRIGSRVIPAFPDPSRSPALVSVYGDSFTWCSEVDAEHAWSNILARRLGRRVNNFGVSGYGTDQAYLRFHHNTKDHAPIVILAHLPENLLRNINQFRDLLAPPHKLGFKPRFILNDDGELELVPLPELTKSQYVRCMRRPEDYLPCDEFVPGRSGGQRRLQFPYTISVLNSFGQFRIRARLRGEPWYLPFYDENHPANGLQITAGILEKFVKEARAHGKMPIVLIIASGHDLHYYQTHGIWTYQTLLDRLQDRGLPVLDAGPEMIKRLEGREMTEIFTRGHIGAHHNAEGYRLLADIVYDHLVKERLVP